MEANEHISYGANEIRDGVSISKQRNRRRVILAAQVSKLADRSGYLRLGYGLPIGLVTFPYEAVAEKVEPFVAGVIIRDGNVVEKGALEPENTMALTAEPSLSIDEVGEVQEPTAFNRNVKDGKEEQKPKVKALKKKLPRRVVDVSVDSGVL